MSKDAKKVIVVFLHVTLFFEAWPVLVWDSIETTSVVDSSWLASCNLDFEVQMDPRAKTETRNAITGRLGIDVRSSRASST